MKRIFLLHFTVICNFITFTGVYYIYGQKILLHLQLEFITFAVTCNFITFTGVLSLLHLRLTFITFTAVCNFITFYGRLLHLRALHLYPSTYLTWEALTGV